jgi:L-fuconolactonase
VYDAFGADKLLWGSDFPHVLLNVDYQRMLKLPERFFTYWSSADRAKIMGANAARLYFS